MRCHDLTQELASPTGKVTPAEVAGHLAACPACAEWSRQAARLDRIWEATRPLETSQARLDAIWANVSAALETQPALATLHLEGVTPVARPRRLRTALILVQAAALLMVASFYLTRPNPVDSPRIAQAPVPTEAPRPIQIAQGPPVSEESPWIESFIDETLIVTIPSDNETGTIKIDRLKQVWPEKSNLIPPVMPHDVMGAVEMMTEPWVVTGL